MAGRQWSLLQAVPEGTELSVPMQKKGQPAGLEQQQRGELLPAPPQHLPVGYSMPGRY